MARSLLANLTASFRWSYSETTDLAVATTNTALTLEDELTSGTGLDSADRLFADTRAVSASANDDIDVAGSLTDPLGQTVSFAKIKGILIANLNSTSTDIITVGGDGTQGFHTWLKTTGVSSTGGVRVFPGGVFLLWNPAAAGYAVTGTTADILRITEVGGVNTVNYKIVLIGTSA